MTSLPAERRPDRGWAHERSHRERGRRVLGAAMLDAFGSLASRLGSFIDAHRTALVVVAGCAVVARGVDPVAAPAVAAAIVLMARVAERVWAMLLGGTLAAIVTNAALVAGGERASIVLGVVLWALVGATAALSSVTDRVNRRRSGPRWAPAWVEGPRRVPVQVLQHETPWSEIHPAQKI